MRDIPILYGLCYLKLKEKNKDRLINGNTIDYILNMSILKYVPRIYNPFIINEMSERFKLLTMVNRKRRVYEIPCINLKKIKKINNLF